MEILFRDADGVLRDADGRVFTLAGDIDLFSDGLSCVQCRRNRYTGYAHAGTFTCQGCVEVKAGVYSPCVLVQRFTRMLWTGEAWTQDRKRARVYQLAGEAAREHEERFGRGKHLIVVALGDLTATLARIKAEEDDG